MEISLSGRHVDLSDQIKEYAHEKIDKMQKYYKRITSVQTVLSQENSGVSCEVIVTVPGHKNIVIKKEGENFFSAIDSSVQICQRKLKQYKNKRREMKGHFHDVPEGQE